MGGQKTIRTYLLRSFSFSVQTSFMQRVKVLAYISALLLQTGKENVSIQDPYALTSGLWKQSGGSAYALVNIF